MSVFWLLYQMSDFLKYLSYLNLTMKSTDDLQYYLCSLGFSTKYVILILDFNKHPRVGGILQLHFQNCSVSLKVFRTGNLQKWKSRQHFIIFTKKPQIWDFKNQSSPFSNINQKIQKVVGTSRFCCGSIINWHQNVCISQLWISRGVLPNNSSRPPNF